MRKRADFIEQKAKIEEEKLKVLRRGAKESGLAATRGITKAKQPAAKGKSTI